MDTVDNYCNHCGNGPYREDARYDDFLCESCEEASMKDCHFCPARGYSYGHRFLNGEDEPTKIVLCKDCDRWEPFYVNVYSLGQGYGGPEEGGWWFTCGEPISFQIFETWDEACEWREVMEEKYPQTGKMYSVLGGDDWGVSIERHFARSFPDSRPYYE